MVRKWAVIGLAALLLLLNGREGAARNECPDSTRTSRIADISLRTNLLYAATASPNLSVDFALGRHFSLGADFGLKPWPRYLAWDFDQENPTKWKHLLADLQFRWWPGEVFDRWFIGADLLWSHFNVGHIDIPLYPQIKDRRLQGDVYTLGLFGGYAWRLARHLRLEAEAGVELGYYHAQSFECAYCGAPLGPAAGFAFFPRLGLNLAWDFKAWDTKQREALKTELLEELNTTNYNSKTR